MSTVKVNNLQVGQSGTATHNFTLTAANADGTAKLARGNVGATTQDVMTVASDGKVDFPAGLSAFLGTNQSPAANGYQKLPGGLILQWGFRTAAAGSVAVSFPLAFPNACFSVTATRAAAGSGDYWPPQIQSVSKTEFQYIQSGNSGVGMSVYWMAIGN